MKDSFSTRSTLTVGDRKYQFFDLTRLPAEFKLGRLPYSLKILLENLLRCEDGDSVTAADIEAFASWDPQAAPSSEIAFSPARVLMQDFTGVPALVDLAAMREAMAALGGDPNLINPLSPADLVIDHSVMVDHYGTTKALELNAAIEYSRNKERYAFLRWGQKAFSNFRVVPPATGIVHQVNLEYLAPVVATATRDGVMQAFPDTVVGTDSHTTMINGLGVLGWGVGGIEAEAAMLGQPVTMLIPQVVGFRLTGQLPSGATATDLVLTVTQMLRRHGVVGKFVEFFGDGLDHLSLADKATIANMAPEYGATCGIFPLDGEALAYLRLTGRREEQIALVEAYARQQGLLRETGGAVAEYSDVLALELGDVEPCIAGPKRPQDRVSLSGAKAEIGKVLASMRKERPDGGQAQKVVLDDQAFELKDSDVLIAAITSCTNTSNPDVIMGAALLARNAVERGLTVKPWVKTSLAPGSQVVSEYLQASGLMSSLEKLGFDIVGFGCTTCIGNSGPLPDPVARAVRRGDLIVSSVLSGNRNFEGRVHPDVRMNFLASPPLVVAYAIAGTTNIDFATDAIGRDNKGKDVYLREIWPDADAIRDVVASTVSRDMFERKYANVLEGDARWARIRTTGSDRFDWDDDSTYIRRPTYFDGMSREPAPMQPVRNARVLAVLGDSVTTDHISPAGSIKEDSPAGQYLIDHGVTKADFNSYGSRRGNHEVMMRGTFANVRLRNQLAPGTEGGWTRFQPDGEQMTIYDAAVRYAEAEVPLVILAGKEYGTGSSRDWAAKGPRLLGVRVVIAESFERIHRSNLVGMGVLPLEYDDGDSGESLGLDGTERFDLADLKRGDRKARVTAIDESGRRKEFDARVRIDTPMEWDYYVHGGILHYVLRQLAAGSRKAA